MPFLAKFIAGGLELGTKLGLGCSGNILSPIMCWGVFNFDGVLIFNFVSSLLLLLGNREFSNRYFMIRIGSPSRLLG